MTLTNIQNFNKRLIKNINGAVFGDNHYYLIRVFYEDTDSGGIVYHSNYLKYFERARTSLLNLMNIDQKKLFDEQGLSFLVREISLKITTPFYLNDIIIVETRHKYAKNSFIKLEQLAWSINKKFQIEALCVKSEFQIVMIDKKNKVRKINKILTNSFFNK